MSEKLPWRTFKLGTAISIRSALIWCRRHNSLPAMLGGRLETPKLPWKYLWIQKLFGWRAAKQVRQRWNQYKFSVKRSWDKSLFLLEGGTRKRIETAAELGTTLGREQGHPRRKDAG